MLGGGTGSTENEIKSTGLFTEGLFRTLAAPYIIPTTIRKLINKEYNVDFLKKDEKIKYFSGVGLGALADLVSIAGYPFAAFNCEIPEASLFPLATNIGSGIYELGRAGLKYIGFKYVKRTLE